MGTCTSTGVLPSGIGGKRLTKEQCTMIEKYLPDFPIYMASTEAHRHTAASHWNSVFKEVPSSRSTRTSHSSATTSGRHSAATSQSASRISVLYDTFYGYLDQHSPELKPVFRSSMHVRGKVLVHISAGMRTILCDERMTEKMLALTKTHVRFGVKLEYFNKLGLALMYAMRVASDDGWSAEIEDAWRHLFTHCAAILLVHHKKALERKDFAKQEEFKHEAHAHPHGPEVEDLYKRV